MSPGPIPDAARRRALRVIALAMVVAGGWSIWREVGPMTMWPPGLDALAGAAMTVFGGTLASLNLRWSLRARRADRLGALALFIDGLTTFATLPIFALLCWPAFA